ncbi:leucyl aminopeptidase [Agarilytica rhodophyticola]|uniref:leucyl aminopeptidase n=1 Tax=Agarilytica rhodophyticola TaxID=1737490 RepID=UPI000B342A02|nr:leucyl aminopeptidase [Agarilytica rhodophyticola]
MEFIAKNTDILKLKTQCAVVFALNNKLLTSAEKIDKTHHGVLSKALKSKDLGESLGKSLWISVPQTSKEQPYERLLLVQLGKPAKAKTTDIKCESWRKALVAINAAINTTQAKDAAVYVDDVNIHESTESTLALATDLALSAEKSQYRYDTTKNEVKLPVLKKMTLVTSDMSAAKRGLTKGKSLGCGINTTRELGNLPGNICTPQYLADQAKSLASQHPKLSVKLLGEKQMEKLGMGSFLSVAKGSDEEGKLIIMEYKNAKNATAPHVLVGKGITFDTGGISLKPGAAMDEMKFDMCGAASVFGAMHALVEMNAPVHVVGIVAAAENMPSGRASKPGDVVTSMSGQTIEILNTDAEGRLVLCDALTYAERFKPKSVVDIATLTGACVIALGSHATGLYSNDDKLAENLLAAGEKTADRAWRMPLWDAYQKQLDSNFADMANIGGREAGSVTAACFLARFTKKYKWAHLDIAGTAWQSGAKKAASGRPVALLVEYLLNN